MTADTKPSPAPDPEEPPKKSRIPQWAGAIAALALTVGIVGVILYYGYQARPGWVGVADKKFWDYLELLIVPAALALGVYWLNRAQQEREREDNEAQQERERKVEEARRKREREAQAAQRERELEVENQRAQDEALQAYLDQMSQLLLQRDISGQLLIGKTDAGPLNERGFVSSLVRSRTLTILAMLDSNRPVSRRKGSILQFLYESGLIKKSPEGVVKLGGESHVAKTGVTLPTTPGQSAADLSRADLRRATLSGADLSGTRLSCAFLSDAKLEHADLKDINLFRTDLSRTNLKYSDLSGADLRLADLRLADLNCANVTYEQLAGCKSLVGATMPNGQKYEEWLRTPAGQDWLRKYKKDFGAHKKETGEYGSWIETSEGRAWLKAVGEDGENSSPS